MSTRCKSLIPVVLFMAAGGPACGGEDTEPAKPRPTAAAEKQVDHEPAIRMAIQSYLAAVAEGDGERACAALTADVQRQVAAQAKQTLGVSDCEDAVAKLGALLSDEDKRKLRDAQITEVTAQGDAATASGTGLQGDVQLVQEDGEWRIAALPTPAKAGADETGASLPADGCSLLSDGQVTEILGGRASSSGDAGDIRSDARYVQCVWETKKAGLVDEKLTVVLVDSAGRYEDIAKDEDAEPVEGVGDAAVAFTGGPAFDLAEDDDFGPGAVNTERVIVVRAGERTLLVERNPIAVRDREDLEKRVPNRRLAAIARMVLEGL